MTTDFRALCADLADRLQFAITSQRADANYQEDRDAIDRARAALAEPESIEDQIAKVDAAIEASMKRIRKIAATPATQLAALAEPQPEGPTDAEIHALADELLDGDSASRVDFARAVLARWGNS